MLSSPLGKNDTGPPPTPTEFVSFIAQHEFGQDFDKIALQPADRVKGQRIVFFHKPSKIRCSIEFSMDPPSTIIRDILAVNTSCELHFS